MTKEEDLDSIVREYLELNGFSTTIEAFDVELQQQGKSALPYSNGIPSVPERVQRRKNELVVMFEQGRRQEFFELWEESISTKLRDFDPTCQYLEFYLHIHFAVYPLRRQDCKVDALDDHISHYKIFLETRGAQLSQTAEFLPFYALPYIPSPKDHPSFQGLFQESWVENLCKRLEAFLDKAIKSGLRSRLSELVSWENTAQHQLHQAFHRIAEMTHKSASQQQRFRKLQEDYHKLMGLASELIGSLEMAVRGELSDIDPIMNLCAQSFPEIFGRGYRAGSEDSSLYGSTSDSSISVEMEFPPLNYEKVFRDLANGQPRQKSLLLQALRWRLTQTRSNTQRADILASYISADLIGCTHAGNHRRTVLNLLSSPIEEVRQSMSRLLNGFASFREGRLYLAQCPELVNTLLSNLMRRKVDGVTLDMTLATLQKLSLRRHNQTTMIEGGMVEWLLSVLEDNDSLSDYSLEYAVALFMNLCLRSSGKMHCTSNPRRVLTVLTDLLGNQNQEIIPYVNGALYSVLSVAAIRIEAQAMAMEDILRCFIQEGSSEMRRQLEFILKQLATETPDDQGSDEEDKEDEEDDDDDEENQDILEEDLDREDCVVSIDELCGEQLLVNDYLQFPTNGVPKPKKRPYSSRTEVLTRPSTPRFARPPGDVYSAPVGNGPSTDHSLERQPMPSAPATYNSQPPVSTAAEIENRPRTREQINQSRTLSRTAVLRDGERRPPTRDRQPTPGTPAARDAEAESSRPPTGNTTIVTPRTPNYSVDVAASEIVNKVTGIKKVLAEAVNSPVPPKVPVPTANEYIVAFSTRPKIPRTPEGGRSTNGGSSPNQGSVTPEPNMSNSPTPSTRKNTKSVSRRIMKT